MILEVAILDVKPDMEKDFEQNFAKAQAIISSMKGYVSHQLQRCIENPGRLYLVSELANIRRP